MFEKIIFWCEFPKKVNWKKAEKLINFPCEIYVAVKSRKEYNNWKRKTKLKLLPWPILDKKEGYWFSGFTTKKDIDKLDEYKGLDMKIDLEPPLPAWQYKTHRIFWYGFKQLFRRGRNNKYLENKIYNLAKEHKLETVMSRSNIIANEFPLLKWYLRRQGLDVDAKRNITKNYMCYTSFAGPLWRPFIKHYMKIITKRIAKKNKNVMFSIGLIGPGILKTERVYKNTKFFKQDLSMINKTSVKKIAIYSLEGLLQRENPEEWLSVIRHYIK